MISFFLFGFLIFDLSAGVKRKVQIVNDDESSSDEDKQKLEADFDLPDVKIDDIETPYQKLLNELKTNRKRASLDFLEEKSEKSKVNKKTKLKNGNSSRKLEEEEEDEEDEREDDDSNDENADLDDDDDEQSGSSNDEDEDGEENVQVSTYAQEVLCKDSLDSEETYKNGSSFLFVFYFVFAFILTFFDYNKDPFHIHFENDLESDVIEKLVSVRNDQQTLMKNQQNINVTRF